MYGSQLHTRCKRPIELNETYYENGRELERGRGKCPRKPGLSGKLMRWRRGVEEEEEAS
jgi:hypothetical protein